MSESILKKLAAKLVNAQAEAVTVQVDEQVEALIEEHFDSIAAARMHDSTHYNNHRSG